MRHSSRSARGAWDARQAALAEWPGGRTSWEHWGDDTDRARASFARLVHVDPADDTVGATVSGMIGLIAASIRPGAGVLLPDAEFTSTLFPFERIGVPAIHTVLAALRP